MSRPGIHVEIKMTDGNRVRYLTRGFTVQSSEMISVDTERASVLKDSTERQARVQLAQWLRDQAAFLESAPLILES